MNEQLPLSFENRFFERHAGVVMRDPVIAIVELVANAWDAGARRVSIEWPDGDHPFRIRDDGSGMLPDEFEFRWGRFDYDRRTRQGGQVEFPPGVEARPRTAYGRNGRGRYAAFHFSDAYLVTTRKNAVESVWKVRRSTATPLVVEKVSEEATTVTGTTVEAVEARPVNITPDDARTQIGLRFLTDPDFEVVLDGQRIVFDDLPDAQLRQDDVLVEGVGSVTVRMLDVQQTDRTALQHGIAWWVSRRLVGECSWKGFGDQRFLDGRRKAAKRYTFIVLADVLEDAVKSDWTGFETDSDNWQRVSDAVHSHIRDLLASFGEEDRREVADRVRQRHHNTVRRMTPLKREVWNGFVDAVLLECPSLTEKEVGDLAGLLIKLEIATSKYNLITMLREMEPGDLDGLHQILSDWTLRMAKVVLDEVASRLELIKQLKEKVHDERAHEVQELQPLFERGLWIFGPEFETIEFTSNEGMTTVVRRLLSGGPESRGSLKRPDFVVTTDSSVGLYSYPSFEGGIESGVGKLVIVELKRPGIPIDTAQMDQARDYALELRKGGHLSDATKVECFVLGDRRDVTDRYDIGGWLRVTPMVYQTVLDRAHSRLFHLYKKVQDAPFLSGSDEWQSFVGGDRSHQRNLDLDEEPSVRGGGAE